MLLLFPSVVVVAVLTYMACFDSMAVALGARQPLVAARLHAALTTRRACSFAVCTSSDHDDTYSIARTTHTRVSSVNHVMGNSG